MIYKKLFISTLLITIAIHASYCNNNYLSSFDCFVQLEEDMLTVGNSKIEKIFKFNNGHLITMMSQPLAWMEPGTKVELESILGEGGNFVTVIEANGQIPFSLKNKNSYTLYKYKTIR